MGDLLSLAAPTERISIHVIHRDPTGGRPLKDDNGEPITSTVVLRGTTLKEAEEFRKWARGKFRDGERVSGPSDQAMAIRAVRKCVVEPNISDLDHESLRRLILRTGGETSHFVRTCFRLLGLNLDNESEDEEELEDVGTILDDDIPTS